MEQDGRALSRLAAAAQAPGAVSEIDIGTIGDFEFFGVHGANSDTAIMERMNNVDGIFSTEVGIQINVPVVETFTDAADPFSDELNGGLLPYSHDRSRLHRAASRH